MVDDFGSSGVLWDARLNLRVECVVAKLMGDEAVDACGYCDVYDEGLEGRVAA
jgi:hypothetical protein